MVVMCCVNQNNNNKKYNQINHLLISIFVDQWQRKNVLAHFGNETARMKKKNKQKEREKKREEAREKWELDTYVLIVRLSFFTFYSFFTLHFSALKKFLLQIL